MIRTKLIAAAILGCVTVGGCVQNYATREVEQGAAAGALFVANAPQNARVLVDGRDVGGVGQSPTGIPLSPGRHDVVVEAGGQRLHSQAIFVSAGARVEVRIP